MKRSLLMSFRYLAALSLGAAVTLSLLVIPTSAQIVTKRAKTLDDQGGAFSTFEPEATQTVCSNGHIDFTTDGGSSSTSNGNVRTYTDDGVGVKARAWERNKSTGAWATAYLGQYGSAGLGVTDRVEGSGDPAHKVDNNGTRLNYIAFAFDQPIALDQINLQSVSSDSDLTVYIGTVANAYSTLPTLSDALLAGFYIESNMGGSSNRDADVNAGNVVGNVVVIAAKVDESNDYFKVEDIRKNCPGTQITFVKEVFTVDQTNASNASFGFTSTGLSSTNFSLVDNNVAGPDRITFSVAANATVSVTETSFAGFTPSDISCVGTQNFTADLATATVNVTPSAGQVVTCTFQNAQLRASAAKVSISGRSMMSNSRPIKGAILTLWDIETNEMRQVTTNTYGHYQFADVEVGKFYVVTISHPRYVFSQNMQSFSLEDNLTNMDFVY